MQFSPSPWNPALQEHAEVSKRDPGAHELICFAFSAQVLQGLSGTSAIRNLKNKENPKTNVTYSIQFLLPLYSK
jgi:hypothetical protein